MRITGEFLDSSRLKKQQRDVSASLWKVAPYETLGRLQRSVLRG